MHRIADQKFYIDLFQLFPAQVYFCFFVFVLFFSSFSPQRFQKFFHCPKTLKSNADLIVFDGDLYSQDLIQGLSDGKHSNVAFITASQLVQD